MVYEQPAVAWEEPFESLAAATVTCQLHNDLDCAGQPQML